ncbi:hypothetical protein [Acinetobacter sp. HR7]|uniref:hypothetical protein n=1 Tax=Acinetobacter sp. HR7 TaxID=1509403 RepID=UPI0005377D70|nr:hypothetical protein [Acinetobacter sp. HR7]KGT46525.1 hypothetical protein GW12_24560 [Acinetobacter sp. HR7]
MQIIKTVNHQEIQQQITLDQNYEQIIQQFQPEVIMAEHENENHQVLQLAVQHWAGYGLYFPKLNQLDQKFLQAQFPKVFLLKTDDPNIAQFEQYGQVVFNSEEYQQEVKSLLYFEAF